MSTEEAKIYVDAVIERLVECGIITQDAYGKMSEYQREELADLVVEKSKE